jgi:hypothetical protein
MRNAKQFEYLTNDKAERVTHLKWCRRNLGTIGRDWEFLTQGEKIIVYIKENNDKGMVAYSMVWL